jgi:hypothetical protein
LWRTHLDLELLLPEVLAISSGHGQNKEDKKPNLFLLIGATALCWAIWIAALCWSIWITRNKVVFDK